jgi:hypothetical protein
MTTRTTVTEVIFTQRFRLPQMDKPFPPGIYQIETDHEILDTLLSVASRRSATRIRLHSPGMMQLLTIDPKDLDDALIDDAPAA